MADEGRAAACRHVYRKFQALDGVRPSVRRAGGNRIYTFSKKTPGPGGRTVRKVVRVTVDEGGKIVKVVASK